jgi:HlyD family secretion protein
MILLRKISFWLALAGLVSAGLLIRQLRGEFDAPPPPPPHAPPLNPFPNGAIGASGLIEARYENTAIGVPVAAIVTAVYVKPWDTVVAGAPLLQLDDRDLRAALPAQQAQVEVAAAILARLRAQLARLEGVSDPRAISAEEIAVRRDDVTVATAQLAVAQASVAQTQTLLERLTVRAPIDGTILQVNVRPGEFINPANATAPLLLGRITEVQVRADIDEQLASRMRHAAAAVGYVKGDTGHPITLRFERIEPFVVPKRSLTGAPTERVDTRVLQVIYTFVNPVDRPVYVGQQIDLFIEG